MQNIVKSSWTPEEVVLLNEQQHNPQYHPYTCANRGSGHPMLWGDYGVLVATVRGWICPFCDYKQDWH